MLLPLPLPLPLLLLLLQHQRLHPTPYPSKQLKRRLLGVPARSTLDLRRVPVAAMTGDVDALVLAVAAWLRAWVQAWAKVA